MKIIDHPDISRVDLARMFNRCEYTKGAEIGTYRGDYAFTLCRANPQATIYCIDPWQVYPEYKDTTDQDEMNGHEQKAHERLKNFNNVVFIKEPSMQAVNRFKDGELDFVYIDANHEWPYVTQDIYHWARKVRLGGIVAGHDYIEEPLPNIHVKQALLGYMEAFGISPLYLIGRKDYNRTWYLIKSA